VEPSERPIQFLLVAWGIVDLVQLPLVAAIVASARLSRRMGRAWKGVAVGFGGYTGWVIVTARFVAFSPSGLVVLLFGLLLDPRRETPPERAWALGSGVAIVLFWVVPVALAWGFRRRAPRKGKGAGGDPPTPHGR